MSYRTPGKSDGPGLVATWFMLASAIATGILVAGVILLVGVRLYLRWSVQDGMQQIEEKARQRNAAAKG